MSLAILSETIVQGFMLGAVLSAAALGLTLVWGVVEVLNVAHGAIIMIGMYITYITTISTGLNPWIISPITIGALFLLGMLIERLTIRPIVDKSLHTHLIVTLGWWLVLENLVLIIFGPDYFFLETGLPFLSFAGISINTCYLIAFTTCIGAIIILYFFIQNTNMGRRIRATARNTLAAKFVGIDVEKIYLLTLGLGCALAGLAAVSIVTLVPLSPDAGNTYLLYAFLIVILGGLGSFIGALVGGIIIGLAIEIGSLYLPGTWNMTVLFFIFIFFLLVRPQGIFGGRRL